MKNNLTLKSNNENSLENPYLIKNMDDFLMFYVNKDGQFNGKYNSSRKRLEKLRNTLGEKNEEIKDPIEYLYYLYHEKKLDLRSISYKLKEIGHIFPHETIRNMFKITFKWKLRHNHEETPGKKIKDVKKINSDFGLGKINETKFNETKNKIQEILEKNSGNNFSIKDYNNIKIKIDKLSYIFYSFGIIQNDSRENFSDFLSKLKIDFGDYRIINIILGIIEELNINIYIKINMKELYGWLNKK